MNAESPTSSPSLDSFCNAAETIIRLEAQLTDSQVDRGILDKIEQWKNGNFRIVVMGEIKRGKSSFINALLGHRDLVPVHSNVATSTIFKISHGPEICYRVFFLESSGKPSREIQISELAEYGTEDGNPGNEKQVSFIQVLCPSPILQSGMEIIDTPGLGGLFRQHKRITYQYVPEADAVFLVTESGNAPLGQAELDLLTDLRKMTPNIYFVQTKAAVAGEESAEARKKNQLEILERAAKFQRETIRYFVVDAETKFRADEKNDERRLVRSGFPSLVEFIEDEIRPNVHRLLMDKIRREFQSHAENIRGAIRDRKELLERTSEKDRREQQDAIRSVENELAKWCREERPAMTKRLSDKLQRISWDVQDQMADFSPNGPLQAMLVNEIRTAGSADEVTEKMQQVHANLQGVFAQKTREIQKFVSKEVSECLGDLAREATGVECNSATQAVATRPSMVPSRLKDVGEVKVGFIPDSLPAYSSPRFEKAKMSFFGGSAGGVIGAKIGAAIGSVIPGAGTAAGAVIGGFIGSLWGGQSAFSAINARELHSAVLQANGQIGGWISSCYSRMKTQVDRYKQEIETNVRNVLDEMEKNVKQDCEARRKEIGRLANENSQSLQAKKEELIKLAQTAIAALRAMAFDGRTVA